MALVWCLVIAGSLQLIGFGIEIGALLAGVALAGTGFQHEIESKIRSLRDFFLIIFFIVLGTHLTLDSLGSVLVPGLVLSVYVLVGNPLIAQVIMQVMGHHPRTAFLAGTTLAQISEFSFIILPAAIAAGLVHESAIPIATIVGLVTIAGSSYLVEYNEWIYDRIAHLLPRGSTQDREVIDDERHDVVMFGYDRMGKVVLPRVREMSKRYMIVDFNPTIIEELLYARQPAVYGDAGDDDVLSAVRADRAKLVISTIPDMAVNVNLLDFLKQRKSKASIVVTVKNSDDAERCYELGATFVIVPSILSGQRFGEFLRTRKTKKMAWRSLGKAHVKMHQDV